MTTPKNLIITTGDASDADGFLSVAMYAKTGPDLLFIMNLPAIYNPDFIKSDFETIANAFAEKDFMKKTGLFEYFQDKLGLGYNFYRPGNTIDTAHRDKLIKLCYKIVFSIWTENNNNKNRLFFKYKDDTGTYFVNKINPFNGSVLLDEVEIYKDIQFPHSNTDLSLQNNLPELKDYENVYMDGNGSFAFFQSAEMQTYFNQIIPKLRVVSVMGGINVPGPQYTLQSPFLNRIPEATMNQVYAPEQFKQFIDTITNTKIPIYFVTNTEVNMNGSFHVPPKLPTGGDLLALDKEIRAYLNNTLKLAPGVSPTKDDVIEKILLPMFNLEPPQSSPSTLKNVMYAYYMKKEIKLFDVMSSLVLVKLLSNQIETDSVVKKFLWYNQRYGLTFVYDDLAELSKFLKEKYASNLNFDIADGFIYPIKTVTFKDKTNFRNLIKGHMSSPQLGGSYLKSTPKPSDKRVEIGGRKRVVYVGKRGAEYVKMNKQFVPLKTAQAKAIAAKQKKNSTHSPAVAQARKKRS